MYHDASGNAYNAYNTYRDYVTEAYGMEEYPRVNRSMKFKFMRFVRSYETFRSPECKKPITARYSGRAVFN